MPRKYDKKTKANFRAGRRNSRRASMRISMVSPGLSMFDEEFDPSIDDTMLMLKAKGIDRERERFAEALTEVRDRISRVRCCDVRCLHIFLYYMRLYSSHTRVSINQSMYPKNGLLCTYCP